MKWNSLIVSMVLSGAAVVAHPPVGMAQTPRENSDARKLYLEGRDFHDEGKFIEAEKKFREALSKFPRAEGSDRTAYLLIDTLVRLRRVQDARVEIDSFRKSYPESRWNADVNEKNMALGGRAVGLIKGLPLEFLSWNSQAELAAAQAHADALRNGVTPIGPPEKIYDPNFPRNASEQAVLLRQRIQQNPDLGIENARELSKINPSDPAVVANLGIIATSGSQQALPFLWGLRANSAASPNARNQAFFWASRMTPDKEQVAKAIMDLLADKETEGVASNALYLMTVEHHRAVLEKIVTSSRPDKFLLMEKIYRNGSPLLRSDLLMFVARLNDPKSAPFIVEVSQNERDLSVRRAATEALRSRIDIDVATLEKLFKAPAPSVRVMTPRPTAIVKTP